MKLRDGISFLAVSQLLGHTNPQMTQRYARTDLEMIKQELAEAHRRKQDREDRS